MQLKILNMGEKRKQIAPGHLAERLKRLSAPKGADSLHHDHQQLRIGRLAASTGGSAGMEGNVPKDHTDEPSDSEAAEKAPVSPLQAELCLFSSACQMCTCFKGS